MCESKKEQMSVASLPGQIFTAMLIPLAHLCNSSSFCLLYIYHKLKKETYQLVKKAEYFLQLNSLVFFKNMFMVLLKTLIFDLIFIKHIYF